MDELTKLLGKLSKYEILNNLIPGAVMCYLLSYIGYQVWLEGWFMNVVTAYVVGLICSRFSSLCIEWLFRKCKFIQWREYHLYNKAKKQRPFIAILQENANMYRTFTSVFLLALAAAGYKELEGCWTFLMTIKPYLLTVSLFLLYAFSYCKQVNDYVVKNIDEVNTIEQ